MANKLTAYEEAVKRRASKSYIESLLGEFRKKQEQKIEAEKAFLGPAYENIPENEREDIIQVINGDPERAQKYLKENLERLEEEAKEGKDLEAIINSAPIEALTSSLSLVGYDEKAENNKIGNYHAFLNTANKIARTKNAMEKGERFKDIVRELDEKADNYDDLLEKLQNRARKLAMNEFKRKYANVKDDYTRKFLSDFADEIVKAGDEVAVKYTLLKFSECLREAKKYIDDENNLKSIRSYLGGIQEKTRLYEAITIQAA